MIYGAARRGNAAAGDSNRQGANSRIATARRLRRAAADRYARLATFFVLQLGTGEMFVCR